MREKGEVVKKKARDWKAKGVEIRAGEEAIGKSYDKLMEQGEKCKREKGEKGAKEMRGKREKGRRKENNGMMK